MGSSSREAELEDGAGGYKLVEEEIEELLSKVRYFSLWKPVMEKVVGMGLTIL